MHRPSVGVQMLLVAALWTAAPAAVVAQPSRCAECHFANFSDVPAREHLLEWEQSAHAKHGIGCEWCHGGNAATFVPADAHKGVVGSRSPASRVHRTNLPATCSTCHSGETQAFSGSAHDRLLRDGDPRAPTCSTCHGAMTARIPSPARLESDCASCHGPDSPGATYPTLARAAVEEIQRIRLVLLGAQQRLQTMSDAPERRRLWAQQTLAIGTLDTAVEAFHAFDFTTMADRLRLARERASVMAASTR